MACLMTINLGAGRTSATLSTGKQIAVVTPEGQLDSSREPNIKASVKATDPIQ
jgi:hypothetical protein